MANGCVNGVYRQVARVLRDGTLTALSDREILERYLQDHDEQAFEAILGRHGGMVLNVCRRSLHHRQDVEDAYQAVFLVLVRKARSLRIDDSLGPWLYRVAGRVAARSRANRRRLEAQSLPGHDPMPARDRESQLDRDDVAKIIRQELDRLPARLRDPLVLCYLEGMTHEMTAQQLGCPVGTVRSRMARARAVLERSLSRRGVTLSAGPMFGSLESLRHASSSAVGLHAIRSVVNVAMRFAAGPSPRFWESAGVSASVTVLMEGVLSMMQFTKLAVVAVALVSVGSLAGFVGGRALSAADEPNEPAVAHAEPKPAPEPSPTRAPSDPKTFTKAYYVGDLVNSGKRPHYAVYKPRTAPAKHANPDQTPTDADAAAPKPSDSATGSANVTPTINNPEPPASPSSNPEAPARPPAIDMGRVIKLIATNVQPGTWTVQDKQGHDITANYLPPGREVPPLEPHGAIVPFDLSISLIIRHTKECHDQVANLLRCVRELMADADLHHPSNGLTPSDKKDSDASTQLSAPAAHDKTSDSSPESTEDRQQSDINIDDPIDKSVKRRSRPRSSPSKPTSPLHVPFEE
jgi:RNA polymerase sigma factor (sigma-70 family)